MAGWSHWCSLAFLQLGAISVQFFPPSWMTCCVWATWAPCWSCAGVNHSAQWHFMVIDQHLVSGGRILQILIFLAIGDSTGFSYLRLHALLGPFRNGACTSQHLQPPQWMPCEVSAGMGRARWGLPCTLLSCSYVGRKPKSHRSMWNCLKQELSTD